MIWWLRAAWRSRMGWSVSGLLLLVLVPAAYGSGDGLLSGRDTYLSYCARCHQADGRGIEGRYPALRDAQTLWERRTRPIDAVLGGRSASLSQDDPVYDAIMPSHGFLPNETVAAALNFVKDTWGPADPAEVAGKAYTTEEVAARRLHLLQNHPIAYSPMPDVSPLAGLDAIQYVTSEGPPISVSDFDAARRLYYAHCTGCHGVLRHGTSGNPLTPELMRELGTEYIKSVINYGSSAGMPGWGTTETLSAEDMHRLALFLQHPVPTPPDMSDAQVKASWNVFADGREPLTAPAHDVDIEDLFVVTLHDVAQVALIDGVRKRLIATVPTGAGPNRVRASASGRYLYVLARDGMLTSIDLYADPPTRVAEVRVGYEARAVGASRHPDFADRFVLAGAYWPPQLVLLDGRDLEPIRLVSTRGHAVDSDRYHPEPRVTDVAGSFERPEFIAQIKETGRVYLFPYPDERDLRIVDVGAVRELRAGRYALDRRHYVTPADVNLVSVVDTRTRALVARVPGYVFGAGPGVSFAHPDYGPVWMGMSPLRDELVMLGTDPVGYPEFAWRRLAAPPGPGQGSMFMSAHPDSRHLWIDTALSSVPEEGQSVAVFRSADLDRGFQRLPIAQWADLRSGPRRVLQPTFSRRGDEVWLSVWNPQDLNSAVVVVDDATLTLKAVIADPAIITPTRIYSVADLMAGG